MAFLICVIICLAWVVVIEVTLIVGVIYLERRDPDLVDEVVDQLQRGGTG